MRGIVVLDPKENERIIEIFKRIMPSGIKFKKIYIMSTIYALSEVAILFIFSYYGIDKAFKENSIPLFFIVITCILVAQFTSNITFALAFRHGNKIGKRINI